MKWLILGAGGMLGRALVQHARAHAVEALSWGRRELDLAQPACAWRACPAGVTHVINAAAYTDVDGAQAHPDLAMRLNGQAVGDLSCWCAERGATLVHFSTDYVFSGLARTPYLTTDRHDPVNEYGASKAVGEALLQAGPAPFLCLRTSWLYAAWGRNFVRTMVRLMAERNRLEVVNDQHGRPTSATHLAGMTHQLINAGGAGVFHACDGGVCTWFDFAQHIARHLGWTGTLEPCDSAAFPRPAARPAYSVLDLAATQRLLGPARRWTEHLDTVLAELDRLEPHLAPLRAMNTRPLGKRAL